MADTSVPQKQCSKCGVEKPATTEYFYARRPGLLRADCKMCVQERINAKNRENPEYNRLKAKLWAIKNPDRSRQNILRWKKENPDRVKELNKQSDARHPETKRASTEARRARLLNAPGRYNAKDVKRQYNNQNGKCYWCGKRLSGKYDVDHIIPLSRGGTNYPDNICCACPKCNRSKSDKLPSEWGRLL